jgi:hypothetical protein
VNIARTKYKLIIIQVVDPFLCVIPLLIVPTELSISGIQPGNFTP